MASAFLFFIMSIAYFPSKKQEKHYDPINLSIKRSLRLQLTSPTRPSGDAGNTSCPGLGTHLVRTLVAWIVNPVCWSRWCSTLFLWNTPILPHNSLDELSFSCTEFFFWAAQVCVLWHSLDPLITACAIFPCSKTLLVRHPLIHFPKLFPKASI